MSIPTYKSGILQVKAYRILQAKVSQSLLIFQINPTEWSILGIAYESNNGIGLTEIANILNVETALITILVNELVQKGLVERHSHPIDKRAKLLFLSPKGKHLVPKVEKKLRKALFLLLTGVVQADLIAYKRVLEAIVVNDTKVK